MSDFIIVTVCHTLSEHEFITLWCPDDCGYTPVVPNAGRYPATTVEKLLDYYNTGDHVAIPASVIESLSVTQPTGFLDHAGSVVPNTRGVWNKIRRAVVWPTKYPWKPNPPKYTAATIAQLVKPTFNARIL